MAASKNSIPNIPTHDAPTSARETADKPNFEKFLSTLGVDGSPLSLEKAHLVAEYWDHNTEYTASAEKGLMSLLDGMGKDRELTIAFQRSIGMGAAADGYIASVKQHRSSTFDAFWKYYEEQKRIAEGRPAPSPLDNPSDFSALLEYAFSDDGTLSDAELDAIARYLGGAEATWKETRMRVASLLDDVATENTADRVLGRKFQQAIGHDESDGLVGGKKESKTIARFWQYYRERRGDGTAVPATPARPSGTTSVAPAASAEALDLPLAIAAQTVADTLRSNKDLSIDQQAKIIAYVRGDISRVSDLIREAAWRALPEADRERFLDRAQGEVRLLIARKFGFAYDASMDEMAFALNFAAATKDGRSPDQRRQDKLVTFAEAVDSRSAGRYVNPRALQAALEKYASPEDGTDWESFARDILSRDIASLRLAMRDELDLRKK